MSWHQNRRISPVFPAAPTLTWENLPYHLNLKEEESLLQYNSGKCPRELRYLLYSDSLLVIKLPSGCLPVRKKYIVMEPHGTKLFLVERMTTFCRPLLCTKFPIYYNIYSEPDHTLVMTFKGSPGIYGGGGTISYDLAPSGLTLGCVKQEKDFCDPIFTLVDPRRGKVELSIQGPSQGNCWGIARQAEFNLCQHSAKDKVDIIGKLYRNLKLDEESLGKKNFKASCNSLKTGEKGRGQGGSTPVVPGKCKWMIEFPRDLDPGSKVGVLSAAFLLESQYYD